MPTVWGVHMEWDDGSTPRDKKDIAIGWPACGDLRALPATRDGFKAAFSREYPAEKAGSVPVKAGVLFRFAHEIRVGDVVVYPSKQDRMINIGTVSSDYLYAPQLSAEYPHRRQVTWKAHKPRAEFTQAALYEIGSVVTLFQIANNAEEYLAALKGTPFQAEDIDAVSAVQTSTQVDESVEDFVIKRLKSDLSPEQFEQFIGGLLRSMGYFARVTTHSGDGGVDIIAHKDELGFEPPVIKVQCKQTLATIGGPLVQRLLGAIQANEHALFVTLGDYSADAIRIERGKSNLRLIGGADLVQLVFTNYERLEPRFKSLLPLKRSYVPSAVQP